MSILFTYLFFFHPVLAGMGAVEGTEHYANLEPPIPCFGYYIL